ncbi:MAG: hypothetical protein EU541_03065 [Promethearchaeota archaeon]|nr:MAG: hypothetical protein EU541_03065 [Candidatus Lokiarchaeota archaeon]
MKLEFKSTIRLLSLFSLFFIWKIIDEALKNNDEATFFWSIFLIIYLVSLTILYIVMYGYQNKKQRKSS